MQLALVIAVALFIVGVAAWPLIAGRRRTSETAPSDSADAAANDHAANLESVYDAIRTLQTEHNLGRISDADFRAQLDEYRRQAALILRDMEQLGNIPQERDHDRQPQP